MGVDEGSQMQNQSQRSEVVCSLGVLLDLGLLLAKQVALVVRVPFTNFKW